MKVAKQAKDPYRNAESDVRDAEEALNASYDVTACRETSRGRMSITEVLRHDDYSSWGQWKPGELAGMSPEEQHREFVSFRGEDWAKRAESWMADGIPAIVLAKFSAEGRERDEVIADGRGRVSFAVGMYLNQDLVRAPRLHVITLSCKGGEEARDNPVAKSPPRRVPKPIKNFGDIKTDRDALEWLENNEPDHYEADDLEKQFPEMFVIPDPMYFNDNDLYGISNRRVWKRDFKSTEGINWWRDNYGRFLVRKLDDEGTTTSEFDAVEGLENESTLDSDDYYELEQEKIDENWDDYGRKDLRKQIENEANEADEESIEKLMATVTDEMLDAFAHEAWSSKDGPSMEETSTNFPDLLKGWDGSVLELGELLNLPELGYVFEVRLSSAAFNRRGHLALRPQDIPTTVKGLIYDPKQPVPIEPEATLCDSPYLTCTWASPKEIEDRPGTKQLKLPNVTERKGRAREHVPRLTAYQRRALLRVSGDEKKRAAMKSAWKKGDPSTKLTKEEIRALKGANPPPEVWKQVQWAGFVELGPTHGYILTDSGRAALGGES